VWGPQHGTDNGEAILSTWTSRDFEVDDMGPGYPDTTITLRHLGVTGTDAGACTLNFYFSADGGKTWHGPQSINFTEGTPGAEITKFVTFQITGNKIRWRMEHSGLGETFMISQFTPCFEKRAPTVT
jgi:hypothetical protein